MVEKLQSREITSKDDWEQFVRTHSQGNFLQSWHWGDVYIAQRVKVRRYGLFRGERLVGVLQVVIEDARRARYLTVPGGPILDWQNQEVVSFATDLLEAVARENACAFVRIRPNVEDTEDLRNMLGENSWRSAPVHLHAELTSQLDITRSEEEIMRGMRKSTRYEIRKAIKEGVRVTSSTDLADLETFYKVHIETAERQKFVPFTREFLQAQFETFAKSGNLLIYSAKKEDKLLATAVIVFYVNEAVYHYGASTVAGRDYPGAFLIQWQAIREAKGRGLSRYNFWGVSPLGDRGHRFSDLSTFKRGFGGSDFAYIHAHDLVIRKGSYLLNWLVEKARSTLRHV
jgi:lipid II:glycine glycyltransferase (peptidoglycan interpeptide bridge formation enzyme)